MNDDTVVSPVRRECERRGDLWIDTKRQEIWHLEKVDDDDLRHWRKLKAKTLMEAFDEVREISERVQG